jgi:hypothetical protein
MNAPSRTRAALYLIAVFVAGALAGAAGGYAFGRRPVFRPPPSPDHMAKMIVERFTRELDLTPEQQEKLVPIAHGAATAMESLHRDTHEKVIAQFKRTHAEVETFLTPEQVGKLREFEQREARKFSAGKPAAR